MTLLEILACIAEKILSFKYLTAVENTGMLIAEIPVYCCANTKINRAMKLRTKILTTIFVVLTLTFGVSLYWMSKFQNELVIKQGLHEAQILTQQIVLTRKWIADHQGVYLLKQDGVEENPFLENPVIYDLEKKAYVLFNPAKVTRELSEYADKEDLWYFRVTSLKPVNPGNAPDEFESEALSSLGTNKQVYTKIVENNNGRDLRYFSALRSEEACLNCHEGSGYEVGDVIGGLSLTIPLQTLDKASSSNYRMLLLFVFTAITVTIAALYLLIEYIIVRRLKVLSRHVNQFPQKKINFKYPTSGGDEVDELTRRFKSLEDRLSESQTELEKTREQIYQSEKLAALGRFSAGVAHEINNPLGGMLNCVKSIKEAPEDTDMRVRYIELIEKGLKKIETTTRRLLNLGHEESLSLRAIDVDALIKECFTLMTHNLKRIEFEYDLNLKDRCLMDNEALKQVIINIGLNAIQSIPKEGKITVRSEQNHNGISISIIDNGVGIEEQNLRKIFDPFFTTKGVNEGTGLGLSVTYALIQRLNGDIKIESKMNEGSCFRVELPHRNHPVPSLVETN